MKATFLLAFLLASLISAPAAQAQSLPYVWPRTVGTSTSQILQTNDRRRRVMFVNPNATAIIAVCPAISRVDSSAVTCTVHGAGSITILPYASIQIDGLGAPNGVVPTAWTAIADTAGSALSVFEWE